MLRSVKRLDVIIATTALAAGMLVAYFWLPTFLRRTSTIHELLNQPRDLTMSIYLDHPSPGLRSESWHFHDLDGYSRIRYTVTGLRGDASVTEPPSARVDVPALYDAAKNDGLWMLPRGQGDSHVELAAKVGSAWRKQDLYFETADVIGRMPREYRLNLAHESAQTAFTLIELRSTPAPGAPVARYVTQLRAFGTPAFRAACEAARRQINGTGMGTQ